VKVEGFFHLTSNLAYPLLLLLCALLLPNLMARGADPLPAELVLFAGTTLSIAGFYAAAAREVGHGAGRALARVPWLMALCTGLCVSQARAVIEALVGRESEFIRTPKHGVHTAGEAWRHKRYRGARSWLPLVELAFAAYFAVAIPLAVRAGYLATLPFLLLFAVGFAYVGVLSLRRS
jgi:hypothetical protein